ncbi:polysaccharide deacetylase [Geomonas sp. Red32]|uniref:polysaccharide deacetylase family protein n=1 Tax=Geomonas sp. Red32 TaxID=2912856 RepID=UPI00202D0D21|nr:polysaccharide deacetylase [Geomonas sp. Red32]MCM0080091.1 polysaccharide deacetylase [Geomonas sp. Red32]
MKPLRGLVPCLICLLLLVPLLAAGAEIGDYRVIKRPVADAAGKSYLAIRSFTSSGVPHLLVVDPATLASYDLPASSLRASTASLEGALGSTPYLRALERYTSGPHRLQNDGARRADRPSDGAYLTVDLCPSHRPFEKDIFDAAEALSKGRPAPVALMISGLWLEKHPDEIAYLKREITARRLAVTWVNHSYHHTYEPKAPLAENFVLTPGTDFLHEVIDLEQRLLAAGLVPSPFFRYPGLVSDAATMKTLRELSLVPVGSDAWLAKGESPTRGSFILVHGNGNEPKGVKLLLPILKSGHLKLLPLPEAFTEKK